MVLIEYAVNLDDNDKEGELASFERMLRKLLSMPRQPALLLVNTMELHPPKVRVRVRVSPNPNPNPNPNPTPNQGKRGKQGSQMAFTGRKAFLDGYSDGPPSGEDMSFEWPAWAEEGITRLGQYPQAG